MESNKPGHMRKTMYNNSYINSFSKNNNKNLIIAAANKKYENQVRGSENGSNSNSIDQKNAPNSNVMMMTSYNVNNRNIIDSSNLNAAVISKALAQ